MKYTRGDTVVGFEKLWFLQKRHATRYASSQAESPYDQKPSYSLLELAVKPILALLESPSGDAAYSFYRSIPPAEYRESIVQRLVFADAQNYTNPANFIQRNEYFFTPPSVEVLSAAVPPLKLHHLPLQYLNSVSSSTITELCQTLMEIPDNLWVGDFLRTKVAEMISMGMHRTMEDSEERITSDEETERGLEKSWVKLIHQYLRWALVGGKPGPDSVLTMELLGMEETGRRLTTAGEVLKGASGVSFDGEKAIV
jgi:glutamyl-tRNA synthetase